MSKVYLRSLDHADARPIASSDGAIGSMAWSPDGRKVAFAADGKLKTITLDSGAVQMLCETTGVFDGASSSSGVIVFQQTTGPLLKIPDTGGVASPALTLNQNRKETRQVAPIFLPDGRCFLYESQADEKPAVYLASLDGGEPALIAGDISRVLYAPGLLSKTGYLMYFRQGQVFARPFDPSGARLMGSETLVASEVSFSLESWSVASGGSFAYLNNEGISSRLTWISRQGQILGTVGEFADYRELKLAPDERRAAFSRLGPTRNICLWIWSAPARRGSASVPATRHRRSGRRTAPRWHTARRNPA